MPDENQTLRNDDKNVWSTYLALRTAMVLLVAMLFVTIILQALAHTPNCVQHSISAYYYTGVRAAFVGTLCAIGVSLIVYHGNTNTENVLLDYSGFMAFVVAFVPTTIDDTCTASNVPTVDEVTAAVRNNVSGLLVVGAVAVLLGLFGKKYVAARALRRDTSAKMAAVVSLVVLAAGIAFFFRMPDRFERIGHTVSATALFAGIIAVVVANAVGLRRTHGVWNRYTAVATAMLVSVAGCLLARGFLDFGHWLLVLEALLIAEFAAFWIIQTHELRGDVRRDLRYHNDSRTAEVAPV
jgi:hypothetical protein